MSQVHPVTSPSRRQPNCVFILLMAGFRLFITPPSHIILHQIPWWDPWRKDSYSPLPPHPLLLTKERRDGKGSLPNCGQEPCRGVVQLITLYRVDCVRIGHVTPQHHRHVKIFFARNLDVMCPRHVCICAVTCCEHSLWITQIRRHFDVTWCNVDLMNSVNRACHVTYRPITSEPPPIIRSRV